MMKKLTALLLTVFTVTCLASCGGKDPCKDGHTYQKTDTLPADCTQNTRDVYTCSECGASYTSAIEGTALGHHFENGFCTECGYADTPAIVRQDLLLFTLNGEGKGYTVKLDGGNATGVVVIPATCCTLPVVGIEPFGFRGQTGMTGVVMPDTILSIGDSAFEGCTGLLSVTFGTGVKTVGARAFHSCTSLTDVIMGVSVDKIGAAAFGGCGSMKNMVLPFIGGEGEYFSINPNHPQNGPVHVLGYIFGNESYSGSQQVVMCHDNDPWGGAVISYFHIPSSLARIEVLQGNYQSYYYYDEILKTKFTLVQGALDGCSMIRELVLPEQIQYTDMYALRGCTGLETLIAPGLSASSYGVSPYLNLKTAEVKVFEKEIMPNVTSLTLHGVGGEQTFTVLDDYDKLTDLTLVFAKDVTHVKLENITPIFDKLTGLILPSPSVELEEGVLSGITTLKRAALPYNRLAGLDMTHLEELTVLSDIGYTVPQILFARATNLTSLTLDARVTAFPANAFLNCTALRTVTFDGASEGLSLDDTVGRWLSIAFGGEGANPLCHGAALYFHTANGKQSAERLTLPEKTTALGAYTFDGCSNLKAITLGRRIVSIGHNAFANTPALQTVAFEGTLSGWCSIAFDGSAANPINGAEALIIGGQTVTDLTGLVVPTISAYAFFGYKGLVAAAIPSGVERIGAYAFATCPALAQLTVPASIVRIDAFAFENCVALYSAIFADPSGWIRYEDTALTVGSPLSSYNLENPTRAADVLVASYVNYTLKKVG